jgi:hydroxyacylglutathione hydrolase
MNTLTLTLGPLATNCYLVWEEGDPAAILIDAADDAAGVLSRARGLGLEIGWVVHTHGHIDHIGAAAEMKRAGSVRLAIHELDSSMLSDPSLSGAAAFGFRQDSLGADRVLKEGDVISVGSTSTELSVLHTPGHSPGSICLLGDGVLFSGDCLFAGSIGRVDLPGGDEQAMMESLARLAKMDPELTVYPGHGPATTIGREQRQNPWLA